MTLTIDLPPAVMEKLAGQAAERHVTVEAVVEDIVKSAAEITAEAAIDNGAILRNLREIGRANSVSIDDFDLLAAQHEGHRF